MTRTAPILALAALQAAAPALAGDLGADLAAFAPALAAGVARGVGPATSMEPCGATGRPTRRGSASCVDRHHGLDFAALAPVLTSAWVEGREERAASCLRTGTLAVPAVAIYPMSLGAGRGA